MLKKHVQATLTTNILNNEGGTLRNTQVQPTVRPRMAMLAKPGEKESFQWPEHKDIPAARTSLASK